MPSSHKTICEPESSVVDGAGLLGADLVGCAEETVRASDAEDALAEEVKRATERQLKALNESAKSKSRKDK